MIEVPLPKDGGVSQPAEESPRPRALGTPRRASGLPAAASALAREVDPEDPTGEHRMVFSKFLTGKRVHATDPHAQADYEPKVALLGASGVGKTSVLERLCKGHFQAGQVKSTIGLDLHIYRYQPRDTQDVLRFILWDTAGQERYQSVTQPYYRGNRGIIAVYSVVDPTTWEVALDYVARAQDVGENPLVMIVGNKIDLVVSGERERVKPLAEAMTYCQENNFFYFEVSALSGDGVERAFQEFFEYVYRFNLKNRPQLDTEQHHHQKKSIRLESSVRIPTAELEQDKPSEGCSC